MTYTQMIDILDTNNNAELLLYIKSIATEEDKKKLKIISSGVRSCKTEEELNNFDAWCREQDKIERDEKLNNLLK